METLISILTAFIFQATVPAPPGGLQISEPPVVADIVIVETGFKVAPFVNQPAPRLTPYVVYGTPDYNEGPGQ